METGELRRWVLTLDPGRAHLGRAQLVRATEVALLTGQPLTRFHREGPARPHVRARWLVVDPGERLQEQIGSRLDAMIAADWEGEVRELERRVPAGAPAWQACGYDTMRQLIHGALGAHAARDAILIATRQYAKRQRTWFRHQLDGARVTRVDPHDPRCGEIVERWWHRGETE